MGTPYEAITAQIIARLEQGTIPWWKPWTTVTPMNLKSQKAYRGINVFSLGSAGYASPYWITYNQAQGLGAHVKKGEHGTHVNFWKIGEYDKETEDGDVERKSSVFMRVYTVFNVLQCEGLPDFGTGKNVAEIAEASRIVANMPNRPEIEDSDAAWYRPGSDKIGMPPIDTFHSSEGYHATLFHELVHSTGHTSRLNREGVQNRAHAFGSETYSKEELVAEMGSAMLCGQAGIEKPVLDNSAAYIQNWIATLKGDSKLLVSAASQAQKAADYILGKVTI